MILLFLVCYYLIHFKFVGIKDMHNIYYLGLSGEHRCPLGYLFMILIIPNIVQNLYLHLSMSFILGLHPPYPTSPTYPKHCYPHLPHPNPLLDPPPQPPLPRPTPPLKFFFFNFHKNFTSPFTSTLTSQPDTPPPPPPPDLTPPPPTPKKKKNFFFEFSQKLQFTVPIDPDPPPPPTRPPLPPPQPSPP